MPAAISLRHAALSQTHDSAVSAMLSLPAAVALLAGEAFAQLRSFADVSASPSSA